jgi:NAD(P)-dependent dehydrogenase (short-subunit alcohol dehydrogenase family)
VITGGTGNLGQAVTARFLAEGYAVLVPWRTESDYEQLRCGLGEQEAARLFGHRADLTEESEVEDVFDAVDRHLGGVDVLLNLVGGFAFGEEVHEMERATWERMIALNLTTAFLCSKHALRRMRVQGAGRIVCVSSKACVDIQPGSAAYAVAKAGVIALVRALREELKGSGITANAVMPGIIDTPATRRMMPGADPARWVKPPELAELLLALCGARLGVVSGSVLRAFGGV